MRFAGVGLKFGNFSFFRPLLRAAETHSPCVQGSAAVRLFIIEGGGCFRNGVAFFYENGAKEWVGSIDDSRYPPGLERQDNAPQVITGKT